MRRGISIGLVSEALSVLNSAKKYNCLSLSRINQLVVGYGVDKTSALEFANQCNWVSFVNNDIIITESGERILGDFKDESISQGLWRIILYDYIMVCRPAWASRIPLGRKEASFFMTNDEKRCFFEAGLLDASNEAIVLWWDLIASNYREERNAKLEDTGRSGEQLTIRYEEDRTGTKPQWVSIETNLAGYDILSRASADNPSTILIEVKSSIKPINEAKIVLTRNEWDVASCSYNYNRYFFYIWLIGSKNQLAVIPAATLEKHIPKDEGDGRWDTTEIPFSVFVSQFVNVQ